MRRLTTDDPKFDRFWAVYPRRVAKGDARKAFAKLNPSDELLQQMLYALEWQSHTRDWTKEGGRYVPYPASWIRGERWTDELPAAVRGPVVTAQWWIDGWREECQRLHNLRCENKWMHAAMMAQEKDQHA